ncbi:MAG: hypothetical protein VX834_08350 [Myxococcota bacterium]|nr:hypothetical protein [Myxococcota bacterium]
MKHYSKIITHGLVALSLTVSSVAHAGAADALLQVLRPVLGVQVATDYPSADSVDAKINEKNRHVVRESGTVVISQRDAADYDTTVAEVYTEMKAAIDELNIFTDSTRVYLPEGTLHKDDIIAVSTHLVSGIISTSYEDVAEYVELDTADGGKFFRVVITTRQENVVDGNYDVTLILRGGAFDEQQVELTYVKRQNLVGALAWLHSVMFDPEDYLLSTRASVQNTLARLTALGYGEPVPEPINEVPWCDVIYDTVETGCGYGWSGCPSGTEQIESRSCKLGWWDFGHTGRIRTCQLPLETSCNYAE